MGMVWSVCVCVRWVWRGVKMVQLGQTEGPIKHSTARSQTRGYLRCSLLYRDTHNSSIQPASPSATVRQWTEAAGQ